MFSWWGIAAADCHMEEVAVVKMNRTEQDLDETASTDDELLSSSIEG